MLISSRQGSTTASRRIQTLTDNRMVDRCSYCSYVRRKLIQWSLKMSKFHRQVTQYHSLACFSRKNFFINGIQRYDFPVMQPPTTARFLRAENYITASRNNEIRPVGGKKRRNRSDVAERESGGAASAFPEINHTAFKTTVARRKRKGGHWVAGRGEQRERGRDRYGKPDFQPDPAILNISDVRCPWSPLSSRLFLSLSFPPSMIPFFCFVPCRSRLRTKPPKALKGNFTTQTFRSDGKEPRSKKPGRVRMAGKWGRKLVDDRPRNMVRETA